jgi:hypothetical protein
VDDETREELRHLQARLGTRSVNDTIKRLLRRPPDDAFALFSRHRAEIRGILDRHGLSNLVAFGSRARGDAGAASDLDLKADVASDAHPLAVLAAEADLEELLGIPVHVVVRPPPQLAAAIRREGVAFAG